MLARYASACHFKTVLACNDDLLYKAVAAVAGPLPFYFAALAWLCRARSSPAYTLCVEKHIDQKANGGYKAERYFSKNIRDFCFYY